MSLSPLPLPFSRLTSGRGWLCVGGPFPLCNRSISVPLKEALVWTKLLDVLDYVKFTVV